MRELVLERGVVDLGEGTLTSADGRRETLTRTERLLLRYLAERPGQAVARDTLQQAVWGYRPGILSRTVFTTVGRLRTKIEQDPSAPRHLVTVTGEGYAFHPHPHAASPTPGSVCLPRMTEPLIGREQELGQLDALVASGARLVSILGPGGVGKSQLALAFAWRRADARAGNALFHALEGVESARDVPGILAAAAGAAGGAGADPLQSLAEHLGHHAALWVLDNLEQLTDAPALVDALLDRCPGLVLLVTSRTRLGLGREHALRLQPLAVPESGQALETSAAGALLLRVASRARPGWTPAPEERDALAGVCAAVGGSPLALQLAGAWLRLLAPAELLVEVRSSLDILSDARRDLPPRHRSVAVSQATSWSLVAPQAAECLRALSVFPGAFDRRTAAEVTGADLLVLGQLLDASMLNRTDDGRFDLHPLMRQDARRRLHDDSDRERAVLMAHRAWALRAIEAAYARFRVAEVTSPGYVEALLPLRRDLGAAWSSAVETRDAAWLARAGVPWAHFAEGCGELPSLVDGFVRGAEALRDEAGGTWAAFALMTASLRGHVAGDLDECLAALRDAPDTLTGLAHVNAAIACLIQGRLALGLRLAHAAVQHHELHEDLPGLCFALSVLGAAQTRAGRLAEATVNLDRACTIGDRLGSHFFVRPRVHRAEVSLAGGRHAEAREWLERALSVARDVGDGPFACLALGRLGEALEGLGDDPSDVYAESLREGVRCRVPAVRWMQAVAGLGEIAAVRGDASTAVRLCAAVCASAAVEAPTRERAEAALSRAAEALDEMSRARVTREGESADAETLMGWVDQAFD